jgi:hypothetical protein
MVRWARFRYICNNGTYKAFYDDLSDGKDNRIDVSKVDVSMDGIELEDRNSSPPSRGSASPMPVWPRSFLHAHPREARAYHRSATEGSRVIPVLRSAHF